jgi:zinc transport system substrate-binding protein
MKRIFIIIAILFCTQACTKNSNAMLDNGKLNVIVTIFPLYDFVREIAGDKINLTMLLPPASESHSFEPTTKDIIAIQKSNIFLYIGGESDEWINRILSSMDKSNMTIIPLIDSVDSVKEEIVEGMEDDGGDKEEAAYDEHIWTSPKNVISIVQTITSALCKADAKNADFYNQNKEEYIKELHKLDAAFKEVVANSKRKTIIFGDRFPFRYFADVYGLSYFAAFPGCSTESEPSAATVAFLINKIKSEKIPVVFFIELSNERMADTIAEETGAKKLLLHASHNISKKDFENGVTYIEIMKQNVKNLKEALQ